MCLNNRIKRLTQVLLILHGIGLVSPMAQAQKSSGSEPVYIESNSAIYDDNRGVSIYTGNVIAKQGGLDMTSDKLTIHFVKGKVDRLEAIGTPVHFKNDPGNGKEPITGKSLEAEYFPNKSLLVMKKEAVVWQGKNTYASEIIKYNNRDAIVRAGEESSNDKRVHVILQQNNKKTVENGKTSSKESSEKVQ